jgi:hypothetical protein
MARTKSIKIRLTESEYLKINAYADSKQISVSEVIRDYIKRLPRDSSHR